MPVQPDISLAASPTGAAMAAGGALANPLDTVSKFVGIQNALNQNQLFQQTFAAKQAMGQIMSTAPDMESGLATIAKSPWAPFAGEYLSQIRQMQMFELQSAKLRQEMAQGGLGNGMKMLAGTLADPGAFDTLATAALKVVDPQAQPQVASALGSLRDVLGSATSPQQRQALAGGIALAGGMTPEALAMFTGKPEMPQTGGFIQPGLQTGVLSPGAGAFQPGGPAIAMSPAPKIETFPTGPSQEPQPFQVGPTGVTPVPIGGGAAPNALGATAPAPAPATLGPGPATAQYQTERGKDMAAYQKALDDRVSVGTTIMQTVSEARDALGQIRTGGGGTAYARLAQLAQAFGASDATVDKIASGNLAASQEFSKLMVNTTMGQIREQLAGIGGSRLSQMEFKSFQENNPNLDTDPRAVDKIFNFWTKLYNRDSKEQVKLNEHLVAGRSLSSWPATWQKIMRDEGMVQVGTPAAGSQGAGPKQWIIQDGKLVPVPAGATP